LIFPGWMFQKQRHPTYDRETNMNKKQVLSGNPDRFGWG